MTKRNQKRLGKVIDITMILIARIGAAVLAGIVAYRLAYILCELNGWILN